MTPPDFMVLGPVFVAEHCPRCSSLTNHERYFSKVWGEVMRRCLVCGAEEKDKPIR